MDDVECFARTFSFDSTLELSGVSLRDFLSRTESLLSEIDIIPSVESAIIFKLDPNNTYELVASPAIVRTGSCSLESLQQMTCCFLRSSFLESSSLRTLLKPFVPSNYRPIGLLPLFRKILEALIDSKFVKHVNSHGLLSHKQHDFRFSRSKGTSIAEFVYTSLDNNCEYLDRAPPILKLFKKIVYARFLHSSKAMVSPAVSC